jgi:hypothetical protein
MLVRLAKYAGAEYGGQEEELERRKKVESGRRLKN